MKNPFVENGKYNCGIAIQSASNTGVKSTNPNSTATIYPPIIPNKNGIILKNPLAFVLINAVIKKVTIATVIC